ncbi:MAG: dienelactone hydrolase [Caulobacteraceae bacterium]|nr:dienelactone hydrolase [Caulobacteraceae bacterium]
MPTLRVLMAGLAALATLQIATPADASIGFRQLGAPDPDGGTMQAAVWYPADTPEVPLRLGPVQQNLAVNAPILGDHLPLIVISHGNGGSMLGHADTAAALAQAGFIAVALTHPHDNYADQSRSTDLPARPRQLSALLDYLLGAWPEHARIDANRIGAFGFSAGGFTVVAAAGGMADYGAVKAHCATLPEAFECRLLAASPPATGSWRPWTRDGRIRAIAAAAPGFGYAFTDDSLSTIHIPVQLWRAADDEILVSPHHVEPIQRRLPQAEMHVAAGARHMDFLTPCPAELVPLEPALCGSAPGFDRVAFHVAFNRELVRFFREALK